MTDLLGPASAPNAVTTRVAEYRTFGNVDTWFKPCSTPASQDGTQLQAPLMNGILAQLRGAIRGNGQLAAGTGPVVPEVNTTDTMLLSAIQLLIARGQPNVATDTGTADALVAAPATPWPEYVKGARLWVVKSATAGANATAAPSIAVSGLAAVTILRRDGSALMAGDLPAGMAFCLFYDGAYFRLVSLAVSDVAAGVQSGKWVYGKDTGAVNAAVVTLFPVQSSIDGQEILVKLAYANTTTTPTINVSGFGTKNIVRQGGGAPAAADLQPGFLPLVWDATNGYWRVNGFVASDILALIAASAIGTAVVRTFTAAGTTTYTPSSGTRAVLVEVQGGGGGGGSSSATGSGATSLGSSGGGGGYARKYLTSGFTGISITVGAGGAGGAAGGVGGNGGGTSSFGSILSATGGAGGAGPNNGSAYPSTGPGQTGGQGTGGDFNANGGASYTSIALSSSQLLMGAAGSSMLGTSGLPYTVSAPGNTGNGFGSGGCGGLSYASTAGQAGGNGAPGIVIITEYK